jgi:hypothetical protein
MKNKIEENTILIQNYIDTSRLASIIVVSNIVKRGGCEIFQVTPSGAYVVQSFIYNYEDSTNYKVYSNQEIKDVMIRFLFENGSKK